MENDSSSQKSHAQTLRQPSESLCNRRPRYFPFREVAVLLQFARCNAATARQKTRERKDKRAKGESLLKSFYRVRARMFPCAPQISNDHHYIIFVCRGLSFHDQYCLYSLSRPVRSVLFSSFNWKDTIGKYDRENLDTTESGGWREASLECKCRRWQCAT